MKPIFGFYLASCLYFTGPALWVVGASPCSTCGNAISAASGRDTGPNFQISLGASDYGLSAGHLTFGGSTASTSLFSPVNLSYDGLASSNATVITTNVAIGNTISNYDVRSDVLITTNLVYVTNGSSILTNIIWAPTLVSTTNSTTTIECIRPGGYA